MNCARNVNLFRVWQRRVTRGRPARGFFSLGRDGGRPFISNPRVFDLHYQDETGPRNFSGDPHDDRYYVVLHYQAASGAEWKIDLSFWLADAPRGQLAHLAYLKERLTPETRLAILALKDLWHRLPAYPYTVGGYAIYDAVLEHHVRTPDDLDAYLRARNLPTRMTNDE